MPYNSPVKSITPDETIEQSTGVGAFDEYDEYGNYLGGLTQAQEEGIAAVQGGQQPNPDIQGSPQTQVNPYYETTYGTPEYTPQYSSDWSNATFKQSVGQSLAPFKQGYVPSNQPQKKSVWENIGNFLTSATTPESQVRATQLKALQNATGKVVKPADTLAARTPLSPGAQYTERYAPWVGEKVSTPIRGATPYKDLPDWQKMLYEMAEPIMWINPEGKGAKITAMGLKEIAKLVGTAMGKGLAKEDAKLILTTTANLGKKFTIKEADNIIKQAEKVTPEVTKGIVPKQNIFKTIGKEIIGMEEKPTPKIATAPPEAQQAASKFMEWLKGTPLTSRAEQNLLYSQERSKQAGKMAGIFKSAIPTEAKGAAARSQLAGELKKISYQPVPLGELNDEFKNLLEVIHNSDLRPFEMDNADLALHDVWKGKLPTDSEFGLFEEVFGKKFTDALRDKMSGGEKAWSEIASALNLPKSSMSSLDLSGLLRQGAILSSGHPVNAIKAAKDSIKAGIYSKWAFEIDDIIRKHPDFYLLEKSGQYMAPIRQGTGNVTAKEEAFMSKLVGHIPGIRQSERSFVTFLNKLRADTFYNKVANLRNMGIDPEMVDLSSLAKWINIATGRGDMPKSLQGAASIANALFFSPRLMVARLETPVLYANLLRDSVAAVTTKGKTAEQVAQLIAQREVSRMALKDATRSIAAFVAYAGTVVGLGSYITGAKAELDPRSSDWLKLKLGDTRVDPWAGFQQYGRFAAQMLLGERKITSTGGTKPINQWDTLVNFLVGKGSPVGGLVHDILAGKNLIGEELIPINKKEEPRSANPVLNRILNITPDVLLTQAKNRLLSLFVQDMIDAYSNEGLIGVAKALPGFVGMGITTYPDVLTKKQTQLGFLDENGDPYKLSNFGSDIHSYGYSIGDKSTGIVKFYFTSMDNIAKNYDTLPSDSKVRYDYRAAHPDVDAQLFFWGRVSTLQNNKDDPDASRKLVYKLLDEYKLDETALSNPIPQPKTAPKTTTPKTTQPTSTPTQGQWSFLK